MFLEHGYGATAMEAIAAQAAVSKGTLYARYPSKADLFAAVVEDRVRVWSARAARRDAELPQGLTGRLEHHVRAAIESMADPDVAGFNTMMLVARAQFPELAQIYFDRAVLRHVEVVRRGIAEAAIDGPVCDDPEAMAFALLEAAMGWSWMRSACGGPEQKHCVAEVARDIVARTLRGFGLPVGQ